MTDTLPVTGEIKLSGHFGASSSVSGHANHTNGRDRTLRSVQPQSTQGANPSRLRRSSLNKGTSPFMEEWSAPCGSSDKPSKNSNGIFNVSAISTACSKSGRRKPFSYCAITGRVTFKISAKACCVRCAHFRARASRSPKISFLITVYPLDIVTSCNYNRDSYTR